MWLKTALVALCLMIQETLCQVRTARIPFLGDKPGFCRFPAKFSTSLRPVEGDVRLNTYAGMWYVIGRSSSEFVPEPCDCAQFELTKDVQSPDFASARFFCLVRPDSLKTIAVDVRALNQDATKVSFTANGYDNGFLLVDVDSVQYSWVVFGDACRKRFFIISIRPVLPEPVLTAILGRLQNESFPVNQAILRNNASCPVQLPYLAAFGATSLPSNNASAFDILISNRTTQQAADDAAEDAIQTQRRDAFNAYLADQAQRRQNNLPPTVFTGIRPAVFEDPTNSA